MIAHDFAGMRRGPVSLPQRMREATLARTRVDGFEQLHVWAGQIRGGEPEPVALALLEQC